MGIHAHGAAAGTKLAARATAIRNTADAMKVSGSLAVTPISMPPKSRKPVRATAIPTSSPGMVSSKLSRVTRNLESARLWGASRFSVVRIGMQQDIIDPAEYRDSDRNFESQREHRDQCEVQI
jgi:hypothetical protein